jgi:hypothetical protein
LIKFCGGANFNDALQDYFVSVGEGFLFRLPAGWRQAKGATAPDEPTE